MLIKLAAVAAAIHSLGQLGTDIYINFYTFVGGEIYSYGVGARSEAIQNNISGTIRFGGNYIVAAGCQ